MVALTPPRELKVGKIIDKTLGVLEISAVPALVFVLVMTAAGLPITYASTGSTEVLQVLGGQLLRSAVGIVCGYFLLVAMLRRTGLKSQGGEDVFLPFVGMSLLASLAVMLGVIAFVLPGLFFMARWSIAQPLLVARGGGGIMATLGESWERTKGNELPIFAAALAVLLLPIVAMIAAGVIFGQGSPTGMVVAELATSAVNLVLMAMGVALYGLIVGKEAVSATPA